MLGLGPVFRLILGLTNTSANTASRNLFITFYCDDKLYTLAKPYIQVLTIAIMHIISNIYVSYVHIYVSTGADARARPQLQLRDSGGVH